jgi:precorrin-6B methylase 1
LSARDEAGREQLQQQASERLGKQADNAHFIHLHDGSIADLLDILSDTHSAVLIMERNSKLLQSATLRQSLNSLDCPLLIVR